MTPLNVLKRKRSKVHGGGRFLISVKGAKSLLWPQQKSETVTVCGLSFNNYSSQTDILEVNIFSFSVSPCEECE